MKKVKLLCVILSLGLLPTGCGTVVGNPGNTSGSPASPQMQIGPTNGPFIYYTPPFLAGPSQVTVSSPSATPALGPVPVAEPTTRVESGPQMNRPDRDWPEIVPVSAPAPRGSQRITLSVCSQLSRCNSEVNFSECMGIIGSSPILGAKFGLPGLTLENLFSRVPRSESLEQCLLDLERVSCLKTNLGYDSVHFSDPLERSFGSWIPTTMTSCGGVFQTD